MADRNFAQLVDCNNVTQIINIQHVVRVYQMDSCWGVYLTAGDAVCLPEEEAEKLIKRLPGVEPRNAEHRPSTFH